MNDCVQDRALNAISCSGQEVGPGGLKEITLVPWGTVTSKSGSFFVDEESAALIEEAFKRHGVDVVIDYDHATLGGKFSTRSGKAPAAGWIHEIFAAPGVGIKALVEWTEKARAEIRAGEFRYLSPVLLIRKSDHRAVELHSAAVTNKPAIPAMERLAASDRGGLETVSLVDTGAGAAEGQVPSVDMLLGEIATALGVKTDGLATVPDTLIAIRDAVLAVLARVDKGTPAGDAVSASARAITDQLASDVATVKSELRLREVQDVLDPYVAKGVLQRGGEEYDDFIALAAINPKLCRSTLDIRLNALPGGGMSEPPTPRQQLIRKGLDEYRIDVEMQKVCSATAAVNLKLRDAGLETMSDEEASSLAIA